jgi:plasmid stabilization system protein ParE
MKYSLHPEAEGDLHEAAEFYLDRADKTLSLSFLAEFERSVSVLLRHPRLGAQWRGRRRYLMRRFPYSIIYTISGEEIHILAVAHNSRRPGYWRKRK